jgi:hypothetical protein
MSICVLGVSILPLFLRFPDLEFGTVLKGIIVNLIHLFQTQKVCPNEVWFRQVSLYIHCIYLHIY